MWNLSSPTKDWTCIPCNGGGFPGGTSGKEPACQCRRRKRCSSIPGSASSLEKKMTTLLQYSHLENSMYRGAWWVTVYGVSKSWTQPNTHTHPHIGRWILNYWTAREVPRVFYYEELTHTIPEALDFLKPLSAIWRPRRTSGLVQFKAKGLRTRGIESVSSRPSPEAWELVRQGTLMV